MLTTTTESAIKALLFLVLQGREKPTCPKEIASVLKASPSYTAKITSLLVKAGILRSHRGMLGGVSLNRDPASITLLDIVQSCEGMLIGKYCRSLGVGAPADGVCSFHLAMYDLHMATIDALSRWTLASLAENPVPSGDLCGNQDCRMAELCPAVQLGATQTQPQAAPSAGATPRHELPENHDSSPKEVNTA